MNRERFAPQRSTLSWRSARPLLAWAMALALSLSLAGCTTNAKLRDQDLSRLRSWYPGQYDNVAQVEADIAANVADVREPVSMVIVPVGAMILGDTVFYVQQNDAMNPRRVLSQRLHRFEKSPDGESILHTILNLKRPDRWLGAGDEPDLLRSIVPDDVVAGAGCALQWKFADGKFTATCPIAPASAAAAVLVELTQTELTLADLSFNGRARVVPSRSADPLYRFERR